MGPLEGIRVLDLSRMIAGGTAGMLLADYGADVVKVEQPGTGDPLRRWTINGEAFWWKVYGRNKRFITLDLNTPDGHDLMRRLVPAFDVVMESFVPGTLERMGLGWDTLRGWHPGVIFVRISGWGQTGPGSQRPGFGTLIEAASGLAAMTGEAGGPPNLPAFPLADMTAALYATQAIAVALYHRDVRGGGGQVIDVSLFESLFSILGPLPAEFAATGRIREGTGGRSSNSGPRACYLTADGRWLAVSASTPKTAERFLAAFGLAHLLDDARFASNEARVSHATELNDLVAAAMASRSMAAIMEVVDREQLTAGPVQTIADIEHDPHWLARELTVNVASNGHAVRMHNLVPRFSETQGRIRSAGGQPGADNQAVYCEELGLSRDDLRRLQAAGIV